MKFRERRQLHNEADTALSIPDHIVKSDKPREFEAERNRPGREPNLESDVMTPIFNTLFVSVGALLLASYAAWFWSWPWHSIIPITITAAIAYFIGYTKLILKTLWITERVFQIDLDRDGEVGEPVTELSAIIEQEDGNTKMLRAKFDVEPALVIDWAKDAVIGKTIAVNAWSGDSAPFTRTEYDNFLETLSQLEFAENVNGKRWQLTPTGKRYFTNVLRS